MEPSGEDAATLPPGLPGNGYDPDAPAALPRGRFLDGEAPEGPSTWIWAVDLPRIAAYSWGEFTTLISARNEKLVRSGLGRLARIPADVDNRIRLAWLRAYGLVERIRRDPDALVIRPRGPDRDAARLLLIGDPGEGDLSQWALRRPILSRGEGIDVALIVSDVIYPAGEALHYRDRFHGPLRELPVPVYAIPGNHDWNDGTLTSFMTQFAGWDAGGAHVSPIAVQRELARMRFGVWRDAAAGQADAFTRLVALRKMRTARLAGHDWPADQPASFFAIDAAGVLFVSLDNGFDPRQELDEVQSRWLLDLVAAHPGVPKILLPGKPLAKRGRYDADMPLHRSVAGECTSLEALVARPENGFVAVIGGDTHNYQRYSPGRRQTGGAPGPAPGEPGNPHLIVAGGSGAYMSGTMGTAERLEDRLRGDASPVLYPTEEQSTWYLGEQLQNRFRLVPVSLGLTAVLTLMVLAAAGMIVSLGDPGARREGIFAILAAAACTIFVVIRRVVGEGGRDARRALGVAAFASGLFAAGAFWAAMLGLVVNDDLQRLATALAFPTAILLIGAAFVPFGVLSQAFPVPSSRAATGLVGAVALTWLLTLAYPAVAGWGPGDGLVRGSTALAVAVLVVPSALVWAAYWSRRVRPPTTLQWVGAGLVALALLLLAAHLWTGWGPHVTEGIVAASAAAVVLAAILWPLGRGGLELAAVTAAVWGLAAALLPASEAHRIHASQAGRALLPALLLALTAGAVVFVAVRHLAPALGRDRALVRWLGTSGLDPWSLFETTTPPFFKSFLEVDVRRDCEVVITCWGVSGFEADAERPILVDRIRIGWPPSVSSPGRQPGAAVD
jgi:hypothetical protein